MPRKKYQKSWSFFVPFQDQEAIRRAYHYSPDRDARKNIAQRLGIESLPLLSCKIIFKNEPSYVVLEGHLKATIIQLCVVNLSPIESVVDSEFSMRFPRNMDSPVSEEEDYLNDEYALLELVIKDQLDIGEAVIQQLGLDIPDFPRMEDADIPANYRSSKKEQPSPFLKLQSLQEKISPK